MSAVLNCDIGTVWEVATFIGDCSWRNDLEGIELVNEGPFVEHAKDGYAATFTTTKLVPSRLWEFVTENEVTKGYWKGKFVAQGSRTEISFTENVTGKTSHETLCWVLSKEATEGLFS